MELGGALGPALVVRKDELPSDSFRPQVDSEAHLGALNGVPARRRDDRCYRSNALSHAARLCRRANSPQAAGSLGDLAARAADVRRDALDCVSSTQ
jgi:hypothetical protein